MRICISMVYISTKIRAIFINNSIHQEHSFSWLLQSSETSHKSLRQWPKMPTPQIESDFVSMLLSAYARGQDSLDEASNWLRFWVEIHAGYYRQPSKTAERIGHLLVLHPLVSSPVGSCPCHSTSLMQPPKTVGKINPTKVKKIKMVENRVGI